MEDILQRDWILYKIEQSYNRGNGLLGRFIHEIKNEHEYTDHQGEIPFNKLYMYNGRRRIYFSDLFPTYYWKQQNEYYNIRHWIEEAARNAGR